MAIHIDQGFILFAILMFGGSAGALLCHLHAMHEGEESRKIWVSSSIKAGDRADGKVCQRKPSGFDSRGEQAAQKELQNSSPTEERCKGGFRKGLLSGNVVR